MFWTAAIADTVIGKTLARKIRKIGALSSTPNQRIATGIQAIGENRPEDLDHRIEREEEPLEPAEQSPIGTPTITAPTNPTVTRKSDATMYFSSRPLRAVRRCPAGRRSAWERCRCRRGGR
jgi:hypothetical protein